MTVNEVKRTLVVCLFAVTAMVVGGLVHLHAQVGNVSETKRKVRVLVRPQYPELAKKLNLTGVVRMELTIGADGKVKRAHVIGGHPVLASEAEKAALQSEFEAGAKETTEVIEFKFSPQQ
jgi:TonB family protein